LEGCLPAGIGGRARCAADFMRLLAGRCWRRNCASCIGGVRVGVDGLMRDPIGSGGPCPQFALAVVLLCPRPTAVAGMRRSVVDACATRDPFGGPAVDPGPGRSSSSGLWPRSLPPCACRARLVSLALPLYRSSPDARVVIPVRVARIRHICPWSSAVLMSPLSPMLPYRVTTGSFLSGVRVSISSPFGLLLPGARSSGA
jgi:hypothetical protein